jgi:uncharacterized protein YcbK (DUF882 family)
MKSMRIAHALVGGMLAIATPSWAADSSRFYFCGDGQLRLDHAHRSETLRIRYRDAGGGYDPQALARIEHFFRSRRDDRSGAVSLRLIELLDHIEDRYRPQRLTLVSGYRSPAFNAALRADGRRVAQASLHTEGMAVDVRPDGLDLRRLWKRLRAAGVGGVGLYQADGFLHLDTGRPRFWEAATSGVEQNVAKENARLFARTDFDRYTTLDGAVVSLHSVTALPIRIQPTAHLAGQPLSIVPRDPAIRLDGDCWLIDQPAERYEFAVTTPLAAPAARTPIRLDTCAPRTGATPEQIVTNPIERLG